MQSQTLAATFSSLHLENSTHRLNGISFIQNLPETPGFPGLLSIELERMESLKGLNELRGSSLTSTALRFSSKTNSLIMPWISVGVCFSTSGEHDPKKPDGLSVPIKAGFDLQFTERLGSSVSLGSHIGNLSGFESPENTAINKTRRTDAFIAVLQVGLAFKIIKTVTKNRAKDTYYEEEDGFTTPPISPVLFVNTRGAVVTESEWNSIFPTLGDPDNYVIDHAIIISEYAKADYTKIKQASEDKIEMYKTESVERVNASILYHMIHGSKPDKK